jgi:hypothetical protein
MQAETFPDTPPTSSLKSEYGAEVITKKRYYDISTVGRNNNDKHL